MDKSKKNIPYGASLMLLLLMAILLSALVIIYTSHENRQLLNELYQNTSTYNKAKSEWGRLILEQSAWTSYGRVEKIAVNQLGMHIPLSKDVRILGQ